MTTVQLDNPYWRIVETFPSDDLRWNKNKFEPDSYPDLSSAVRSGDLVGTLATANNYLQRSRHSLVRQYAWAIPSDDTITWLAERFTGQDFVEIGAGRGYWAYLLEQVGVTVTAYDDKLIALGEENGYFNKSEERYESAPWQTDITFHSVLRGGPEKAANHSDKVLFLCWPPYGEDMALDALRAYSGDTLVYIGEGDGGCCADDDFFRVLQDEWEEVECYDQMIQWSGIHDYLWVYRRKNPTLIQEEP